MREFNHPKTQNPKGGRDLGQITEQIGNGKKALMEALRNAQNIGAPKRIIAALEKLAIRISV